MDGVRSTNQHHTSAFLVKISGSVTCPEILLRPDGYVRTSIEKQAVLENTL